jgi:hypothetical protein
MVDKDQRNHDIAVAFATAEYKNNFEWQRASGNNPDTTAIVGKVVSFASYYREAVAVLTEPQRFDLPLPLFAD